MRRWIGAVRLGMLLVACAAVWTPTFARGQARIPVSTRVDVADVDNILRVGVELEQQRRWGEALSHYEDALRKHPGQRDLAERLLLARLHYEVARRYSDSSYLDAIRQLQPRQAGDLYGEVLQKLHNHHVDQPAWQKLFDKGTTALEIALAEPTLQTRFGLNWNESLHRKLMLDVQQTSSVRPIQSRQDSRDAAVYVAQLVERQSGIPQQAIILEYACAAVASLDDYSAFLTGNQLDEILSQIEGNFVGLGIELKAEPESLLIVSVIPGGPADRGGLQAGDKIVRVAGRLTSEITSDAAADMLKGPEGTTIDLEVVSSAESVRQVTLRRRVVEVPSVEHVSIIDRTWGIGYVSLTSFQKTTSRDMESALWKLHREGMRSLIIDLRGNPGGLLTSSVEIADKFITEGTIVSTRGRGTGEDFDYKAHLVGTWRVPLVVLIDGNSASASEIFAAAIRDAQRGTIVGERSFGKGSVQGIFPLNIGNTGLRITTAKFYSPSHHPISGYGVQPHVLVHKTARPTDSGEMVASSADKDAFIQAALQVARRQLTDK
jgi:carboxyl-terminal processing protease